MGDVVMFKMGGLCMIVMYVGLVVFDDGDWLIC